MKKVLSSKTMLSPEKFVALWGEADLFRFPSNLLEDLAIPDESKTFLSEAGLPKQALFVSGVDGLQLLLPDAPAEHSPEACEFRLLEQVGPYRVFALCAYETCVSLDESTNGQVVLHRINYLRHGTMGTLVNMSIPQFAESLLIRKIWLRQFTEIEREYPDFHPMVSFEFLMDYKLDYAKDQLEYAKYQRDYELWEGMINWQEQQLRRIDPAVFFYPDAIWPDVVRETREGC